MEKFYEALVSREKSKLIPDEYDYWKNLIGSWDLNYVEGYGTPKEKHVKGEWHFARILEGLGIEDIFICPAGPAKERSAEGEYGATIRMFNPATKSWDMVYTCQETMDRFTGTKEGDRIVLTNLQNKGNRWVFSDITRDSFHWQNETVMEDGTVKVWCQVFGVRQREMPFADMLLCTQTVCCC